MRAVAGRWEDLKKGILCKIKGIFKKFSRKCLKGIRAEMNLKGVKDEV